MSQIYLFFSVSRMISPWICKWLPLCLYFFHVCTQNSLSQRGLPELFIYFILFYFLSFVQYQLSPFSPHHSLLPYPPSPPTFSPPPLVVFLHGSFIHVPWWPFHFFALLSASFLPSGYCQFVLYFHFSGYILLACSFCCLGSTCRWDHMVFVFNQLA